MNGRLAFGLTATAFAWSLALIVGALVVPVYSVDSDPVGRQVDATLVGENGAWVLAVVAIPAAIAAIVWAVLHRRCTAGRSARAAFVLVFVLAVFTVLSMASIGVFVLPVVLLLTVAARLTPLPAAG